jgi:hypothetical protein
LESLLEKKFGYSRNHNRMKSLSAAARECGRIALIESIGLRSHDSLAHVRQELVDGKTAELEQRIYTDFITDIAERDPDAPFNGQFHFIVEGDKIITGEGDPQTMQDLGGLVAKGLEASKIIASKDKLRQYGVLREQVQLEHIAKILDWYHSDTNLPLLLTSLCPGRGEVDDLVSRANGFNTSRRMASMWVYAKSESGIDMSAFSLDDLDLDGLRDIFESIGIQNASELVRSTTLEQLAVHVLISHVESAEDAAQRCIKAHDKPRTGTKQGRVVSDMNAEANSRVRARPEAYHLYKTACEQVGASLKSGSVNHDLFRLARELSKDIASTSHVSKRIQYGADFSVSVAREFMDYLRSQVIPQYVFSYVGATARYENGDFSGSGGDAVSSGKVYEGACPGSTGIVQNEEGSLQDSGLLFGLGRVGSIMELSGKRITCPDCNSKVVVPDSLLKEGILHCSDCDSTLDVCGDSVKANRIRLTIQRKKAKELAKAIKARAKLNKQKVSEKYTFWSR